MKRIQPELVPLLLAAFLAPIIGGNVSLEALPLDGGFFSGMLGGSELPQCARALLGILIALSLGISLIRRKIVQIPSLHLAGGVLALVALLGLTIFESSFPYVSYSSWLSWVVYGLGFFAAVGVVGRKVGVRALGWALVGGGTVTAFKAIQEYANFKASDPSHRVFGDWNNPNALAGIFAILVPLAIGLLVSSSRLESLGSGLCASVMMFGLVLTQSKGGLLTVGMAIVVVATAATVWRIKRAALKALAPVALAGLMVFASLATSRSESGALGRISNAGASQEQSSGFRQLLWKGAVELVKMRPGGFGVGAYRFESGRPGLTEQTFHAHQTWLQLAVEGSPLAMLLLIAVAVAWLWTFLSNSRHWPPEGAGLRAGILGAVVAAAVNGFFETNLTYFGIGTVVFMIMGAGLQTASDGSLPEFTPKGIRRFMLIAGCVLPVLLLVHTASVEYLKSEARSDMQGGNRAQLKTDIELATALAPFDGEAHYLASALAATPVEQLGGLALAAKYQPSTKYLRAAAKKAQESGDTARTAGYIDSALSFDPNNLATLEFKYKFQLSIHNKPEALETARRLVAVENGPYFRVRAIPELVPLETYDARVFLAENEPEAVKRAVLLEGAIAGYAEYFKRTYPMVKTLTGGTPGKSFLGHDADEARTVAANALKAIDELRPYYRESGNASKESEMDGLVPLFRVE